MYSMSSENEPQEMPVDSTPDPSESEFSQEEIEHIFSVQVMPLAVAWQPLWPMVSLYKKRSLMVQQWQVFVSKGLASNHWIMHPMMKLITARNTCIKPLILDTIVI